MDIILEHVWKSFDEKRVLRDISCRFPEGKTTCLMGPSGSGKTTLLNILAGLTVPDGGSISGVPEKISMVFQEDRLCEDFSVLANTTMAVPKKEKEALRLLAALGLENELSTPVRNLSGGMKRRVAIARALLYEGDLLLLDEAFKGLDPETKEKVMQAVGRETKGKTVISVTHDEQEALDFGDSILKI